MKISSQNKKRIYINCIIIILVAVGTVLSFTAQDRETLSAKGIKCLKYFTVDSNIFAGIAAIVYILSVKNKWNDKLSALLKLAAVSAVSVTFFTVIMFLGPLYGFENMYHRANFLFHLVVPILAVFEFVFFNEQKLTVKQCLWCPVVVVVYGIGYIINLFVSGFEKGDFYGFVKWGLHVGFIIFVVICLISFVIGLVLRALNRIVQK